MSRAKWRTREQRIQRARAAWRREWRFLGRWILRTGGLAAMLAGTRPYPRSKQYLRAARLNENNARGAR